MARAGTQIREAFTTINKPRRLTVLVSLYPDQARLFTEAISLFGGNSLEAFATINKPWRLTILARAGTQIREAFTMINKPRRLAVLVSQYPE
ncbi:hypothetical protein [Methylobacter sp. S3L5C]|uniref:hypothetical protein n=1 Tax=Methylobacter sp. S3L5C TaxID=2839024 RepID=UPI001FADA730|nr:hypothetical protein [Methylobacter sp. S3L5C]UOA08909.1 hypothetical protein KKZ03_00900 [Methylobacter sp. S3L5C]UOA08916.1 hypothetical protein KKZ03_00935 [Methylobacter sp. S3L5C]UOA08924.1 hypothetical protein KKZ03_00975 [Methylobacter sp. S3L5C]UOA08929.1 hypothetical protein KKZ03_01000 [Methylobacter sp. S3L5C]